MTDWSGRDYVEVSNLQRAMATEALASLRFGHDDRVLDPQDRAQFIADLVRAYEPVAGRPCLFRFTQMRALLRKGH